MKKSVFILIAVLFVTSAMVLLAGAEEKKAPASPEAVFVASKCTVCHKIERVCAQVEEKNAEQWAVTVKRMASKGTGISEVDQKRIVKFLSSPADRTALCPD